MTATLEAAPRAAGAFRVEREGDLATVWFDLPGEKVNKFSSSVMTEFAAVVEELERSTDIKRVVVASGKPSPSISPMSPVWNHPSLSIACAVASGLFQ